LTGRDNSGPVSDVGASGYCFVMALVRVRGCADRGSTRRASGRQADASRRRNGPRKVRAAHQLTPSALSTVRLSSKSCPAAGHDVLRHREKGLRGTSCKTSAGECGDEDQVGRASVTAAVRVSVAGPPARRHR
jgi:hypothetical protein